MRISHSARLLGLLAALAVSARAETDLFDFDTAPFRASLPLDLTVGSVTAHFSASPGYYNYSIQRPSDTIGLTPAGFSGYCIAPSTVYASDLLVSFSQPLSDFSILYAPQELATDASCTMKLTLLSGSTVVGSTLYTNPNAGTWPSGTLGMSSAVPFDNVIIHYQSPPAGGGDYGPIFVADNMSVTVAPEPSGLIVLAAGMIAARPRRRRSMPTMG